MYSYTHKPDVVAFSETWLSWGTKYIPKFVNYTGVFKNRVTFAGGLGFLVKHGVQHQNINLVPYQSGYLEVQAVKVVTINSKQLCILNIYNPGKAVTVEELRHYIAQLGDYYIITGDLNAHTKILDSNCNNENSTGKSLENILINDNVCINNPLNMYTYVSPTTGKRSCLDVCMSSSNIAPLVQVTTSSDIGSDHVPLKILIEIEPLINVIKFPPKWKINASNILKFTQCLSNSRAEMFRPCSVDALTEDFINRIRSAALETLGQTSGEMHFRKKRTIWWNDGCSRAVAERRRARRILEKHPTKEHLKDYREKSLTARNICRTSKRESFREYIGSLQYDTPKKEIWQKIRAVKNKSYSPLMPIEDNGNLITDSFEKANRYAKYIENI